MDFTGVVLSKLDGDARGGAALSVASVTGKPILFASNGEGLKDFEVFHPDRMASRILDMGDIMTLIEQAQKQFDEEEARKAAEKISEGSFGLDDFLDQLQQVRKLGSMKSLLGMIPGMAQHRKELEQFDEREIDRTEAIIRSMTPAERRDPSIINGSRRARIAYGSGVTVSQVNALLQRFEQAAKMMKRMSNRGGMGGGIPGFGGPAMGGGKKKGKNKKKGGKSGNPMKREAEEKALRDKLAGKSSGSTGGSAFAKKPQNPALPAGLEQMMGNVDGGTELPPNLGGAWRTVRSLISQLAPLAEGSQIISRFNLYFERNFHDDNPQRGGNHRTVMDDLKRAARRSRGPYAASVHDCPDAAVVGSFDDSAAVAAWQHEWTAMSLLIVVALIASSQRINYWGTSIDRPGNAKNPTVKQPVKQLRRRCQKAITAIHRVPQTLRRKGPKPSPMDTVKQRVKHSRPSSRL